MEFPPRKASHVPTIKCSDCGKDIDLSSMEHHACSTATTVNSPPTLNPGPGPHSQPQSSKLATVQYNTSFLKPQRPALPKIDSSVSISSPLAGELTPASSNNGSIGSPVSATSARKSPWKAPRKTAMAIQQGPPSPELTNLDCAFPPFPTGNPKSSGKSSKTPTRSKTSKSRKPSPAESTRSSRQMPGTSSLSRTQSTISSRQRSKSSPWDTNATLPPSAPDNRRPSVGSISGDRKPSVDVVPPMPSFSPNPPPAFLERADSAPDSLTHDNKNVMAPKPGLHRFATADDVSVLQSRAPRPHRGSYTAKAPPPIVSQIPLGPDGRPSLVRTVSPTPPIPSSGSSLGRRMTKLFGRRRSQSAASSKREMVRSALSDEPDEVPPTPSIPNSAFESPRQAPLTPYTNSDLNSAPMAQQVFPSERKDSLKTPESEEELQASEQPTRTEPEAHEPSEAMTFNFEWNQSNDSTPVPVSSNSIAERPSDANRASIDSASSYGSVDFTERTASSRSSPPPTDELAKKLSERLRVSVVQPILADMPPPLRPRTAEVSADSPTDPLFVDGRLSPIPMQDAAIDKLTQPSIDAQMEEKPVVAPVAPPRKDSLAEQGRALGPHKGICRGCSKPIMPKQKSVSSADGRLTGKYHKECFTCWTCKAPFTTAEIHVHADHPYCAYHYHELENSLCATCGKGIEGLYMETANVAGRGREKHHPECLKCTTCRMQLNNDYFELSGKVYCERDAFRLASMPRVHDRSPARPSPLVREYISSGNPDLLKGKNFPERRVTRLMTTA